jgi:hypothetical protein
MDNNCNTTECMAPFLVNPKLFDAQDYDWIKSYTTMVARFSENKTKRKHPNRPMKLVKNRLELGEFDHLKKGRVYKLSISTDQDIPYILYKNPELMPKDRIGTVSHGSMVIYLETIESDSGLFHKFVVDDQVGYVFCNNAGLRLKRITSRMLRRLEANVKESNNECETEES